MPNVPHGLAPFFDQNGNGVYEPMLGDVPNINNADQGIWWVFNDAGNIHTQSNGATIGAEIQVLAYAYVSSNESINNVKKRKDFS